MNDDWLTVVAIILSTLAPFAAMIFLYSFLYNKQKEDKKRRDSIFEDQD